MKEKIDIQNKANEERDKAQKLAEEAQENLLSKKRKISERFNRLACHWNASFEDTHFGDDQVKKRRVDPKSEFDFKGKNKPLLIIPE